MEQEEKKDGDYALNTFKDIWKYDPARLLDLGNSLQVVSSLNNRIPEVNEEARAISNFEKLTEDRRRPISHTVVDATRLLPEIITLVAGPIASIIKKGKGAKGASKVAKAMANENMTDIAKAFNNSKLLQGDPKDAAATRWVRNLYENKEAMDRIALKNLHRNLSDDEIRAVRKELPNAITEKIKLYNEDVNKLKTMVDGVGGKEVIASSMNDLDSLRRQLVGNKILTKAEWDKLGKNLAELPAYDKNISFSHLNADRILKGIPKEKQNIVKDILFEGAKEGTKRAAPAITPLLLQKAADAGINKAAKINFQTNKELEMKPDYWTLGSEPTPVSDFIASVFNVDFDDPTRFNKRDIDAFFEFLEDIGTIEPGIKDKWTPRQKVSVLREMMSDKDYGQYIKERWAKSNHRKNWLKSYSGE